MAVGYTYTAQEECPICCYAVNVTKVRSRLIKVSQDNDFCMHYKDFNPYYYTIWACQNCGYAADGANFKDLKKQQVEKLANFLINKKISLEYTETRTREQAIVFYKKAIFLAGIMKAPVSRIGALCLKLAWLYREAEDADQEKAMISMAVRYYDQALSTERFPVGSMTDNAAIYLVGVLFYRLGETEKATQYLSRLIGDKTARMEYHIYKKARDLWQEIRELKEKEEAEKDQNKE